MRHAARRLATYDDLLSLPRHLVGEILDGTLHTLQNTNQIIDVVPNPLLSKTGFTDLAGGNLVIVFDAGINHPVAIVVLGSTKEERFTDVRALVNETLSYFSPETTPPVTQ